MKKKRMISMVLAAMLLLGLFPGFAAPAEATSGDAGQYLPVYFGSYALLNAGISCDQGNLPKADYTDKEYAQDDNDRWEIRIIDPEGSLSRNANADQMPTDMACYNMVRAFGTTDDEEEYPASAISGFTCASWSGNTEKDSEEKVRKARMINYGAESESNNNDVYPMTFGMNGAKLDGETHVFEYYVKIADNPTLKTVAALGQLQFHFSGLVVSGYENNGGDDDHCKCTVKVFVNTTEKTSATGGDSTHWHHLGTLDTGWISLSVTDVITIQVAFEEINGDTNDKCGLCNGVLLFRDVTVPTASFHSTTNATVNADNTSELLMKLGTKTESDPDERYYTAEQYQSDNTAKSCLQYIDYAFSFSEPVSVANLMSGSEYLGGIGDRSPYQSMVEHPLFFNTTGTGYVGQGLMRTLDLYQAVDKDYTTYVTPAYSYTGGTSVSSAYDLLDIFLRSMKYRYSAQYGDFSSNTAIPNGGGIEQNNSFGASLLNKIRSAGFHDAAGNPLTVYGGGTNLFSQFGVIVDAVPPTYSRVGSSIIPDALTSTVLNAGDAVEFIVSFSEAAITRRDLANAQTYLLLNNGKKAYFTGYKNGGKQWVFRYQIGEETAEEAALLKVIALSNDGVSGLDTTLTGHGDHKANLSSAAFAIDARVVTDYVGNILAERANEDGNTNSNQIESSISWANLAVDNTAPGITFAYSAFNSGVLSMGSDGTWGQASKITVTAEDPDVPVPPMDPSYTDGNTARPSKGVYRPTDAVGGTASSSNVGQFYYAWTRSATPPSVGTNFEAVKRYAMTGIQPRQATKNVTGTIPDSVTAYATAWQTAFEECGAEMHLANNFSSVVPPSDAMTGDGDGAWYLHIWTADMTWDSARQRMQYDLAKSLQYKTNYDAASTQALIMSRVDEYRRNHTFHGASPAYKDAWEQESVKNVVYTTAYTEQFCTWLSDSGKDFYSDDAMTYARIRAMQEVNQYDDLSIWGWDKYDQADSNWTCQTARLLLDNTAPAASCVTYHGESVTGNNTAAVFLPVTIADDGLSGIDTEQVYYQWVRIGDMNGTPDSVASPAPVDANWIGVEAGSLSTEAMPSQLTDATYGAKSVSFDALTAGNVSDSGTYVLYLRYQDKAGNRTVADSGSLSVVVNKSIEMTADFGPEEALNTYQKSVTPTVVIGGLKVKALRWAVSGSAEQPTDAAAYTTASLDTVNSRTDKFIYCYTLTTLDAQNQADGTAYLHILVDEDADGAAPRYICQAYRLDNTGPSITIDPDGAEGASASVNALVSVTDSISAPKDGSVYYQVTSLSAAPALSDGGWLPLPSDGSILLDPSADPAITTFASYYVHVKAEDVAGNTAVKTSAKAFTYKCKDAAASISTENPSQSEGVDFADSGVVTLTTETDNATIYYTAGSDAVPTKATKQDLTDADWSNWQSYDPQSGVVLHATTALRAIVLRSGMEPSAVTTFSYTGQCAAPVADPSARYFAVPITVRLSTVTPDAEIYYTTDGSAPTSASTQYHAGDEIELTQSTEIKAIAYKDGALLPSEVMSASYTFVTASEESGTVETGEGAITANPEVTDGAAKVEVGAESVRTVLEQGEDVEALTVTVVTEGAGSVTAALEADAVKAAAGAGLGINVETENGVVKIDAATVKEAAAGGKDVAVTVTENPDGTVTVNVASGGEAIETGVKVALPATKENQILVIVNAEGKETPVCLSATEDGEVLARIPAGATVKVVEAEGMRFGDVNDTDWFAEAVTFVTRRGIFNGTGSGFEPRQCMNRAMIATVLFRLSGESVPANGTKFGDVAADAWYADAVAWVSAAGIVKGTGKGFEPNAPATREQIATMLHRFVQHLGVDVSGAAADMTKFSDSDKISTWAGDAMTWAVSVGLFRGDDHGALNPGGAATRAEVATLVARLVSLLVK